jgi:hypothetical protein
MLQLIIPRRPLVLTGQATQYVGDNFNDSCNQLLKRGFYITTKHMESRDLSEMEETSCFTLPVIQNKTDTPQFFLGVTGVPSA